MEKDMKKKVRIEFNKEDESFSIVQEYSINSEKVCISLSDLAKVFKNNSSLCLDNKEDQLALLKECLPFMRTW